METKFTPEPWEWNDDQWGGEHLEWRYDSLTGADGTPVLELFSEYCDDSGMLLSEANASLIAAAPDMYDVLISLKESMDGFFTDEDSMSLWDEVDRILAKARGETDNE